MIFLLLDQVSWSEETRRFPNGSLSSTCWRRYLQTEGLLGGICANHVAETDCVYNAIVQKLLPGTLINSIFVASFRILGIDVKKSIGLLLENDNNSSHVYWSLKNIKLLSLCWIVNKKECKKAQRIVHILKHSQFLHKYINESQWSASYRNATLIATVRLVPIHRLPGINGQMM